MAQRPGPQRQLGPKPLMGMETATSLENLGPADQELVVQVAQITGLSDVTLVVSALEALRALDPNMIQTLGALNTEAMSDLDPSMVQTLLDAIGGGAQDGPRTPASGPRGPMGHGPQDKRRMPMGKSGGPPKKMRFWMNNGCTAWVDLADVDGHPRDTRSFRVFPEGRGRIISNLPQQKTDVFGNWMEFSVGTSCGKMNR